MKKLLVIAIAVVFVFAFATAAFAVPGISQDGIKQGGYDQPSAGVNPHGSYSTASNKCKTCHAVHGATAGGEALLRSSRANACVYCHVSNNFTIAHPYGTDPDLYTTDYENNHAAEHFNVAPDPAYAGCVSCHSVHGANTFTSAGDGITAGSILKKNPGGSVTDSGTGAIAGDVANLDEFCRDCHDGTAAAADYCVNCHATQMGVTELATRNGVSHIMTTNMNGVAGTQVAWTTSETCRKCHKGGDGTDGNSFPHLTSGADFLTGTHTTTSPLDRVCLECHQNGGSGVGLTF